MGPKTIEELIYKWMPCPGSFFGGRHESNYLESGIF